VTADDTRRYKENRIGFRWRTEAEVIDGKGQFVCGNIACSETTDLRSYEVNFGYVEAGARKNALVKLLVCPACALKLFRRSVPFVSVYALYTRPSCKQPWCVVTGRSRRSRLRGRRSASRHVGMRRSCGSRRRSAGGRGRRRVRATAALQTAAAAVMMTVMMVVRVVAVAVALVAVMMEVSWTVVAREAAAS
jgi:protein FRA10AC1